MSPETINYITGMLDDEVERLYGEDDLEFDLWLDQSAAHERGEADDPGPYEEWGTPRALRLAIKAREEFAAAGLPRSVVEPPPEKFERFYGSTSPREHLVACVAFLSALAALLAFLFWNMPR